MTGPRDPLPDMFLIAHAPVGAVIGTVVANPFAAAALGMFSHFVLDLIPHGDEGLTEGLSSRARLRLMIKLGTVDTALTAVVLAFLLQPWETFPSAAMLSGILGAVLPDVLEGAAEVFPANRSLRAFQRFHHFFHFHIIRYDPSLAVGLIVQLATLVCTVNVLRAVE